jgi:hypothetical protein
VYRTDELGQLAQDIVAMVRVIVHDLQRQMVADLKIPVDMIALGELTNP